MEEKIDFIKKAAAALVGQAREYGLVLTIEIVPDKPLAVGNYHEVVSVRPARVLAPETVIAQKGNVK